MSHGEDRRQTILDFWRQFTDHQGLPPTIRQATAALDLSSTSVCNYWLTKLVEDGLLDHVPSRSHAYRLPRSDR